MEGKIEGIFFSEFHPTKGPKIVVQVKKIAKIIIKMYLIV